MTALDFAPEELAAEGLQIAGVDRTTVGQHRPQQGSSPQPILHSDSDEFGTPDYIFKPLDAEFHFTLDVAASETNRKCPFYFSKAANALTQDWVESARRAGIPPVFWCNPPYSRGMVEAFVQKAYEESQRGATVVMLLPTRTEQPWFHDIVLPNAEIRFIRKRIRFVGGTTSARFPSMVAIFPKRRGVWGRSVVALDAKRREMSNAELSVMINTLPLVVEPRCVA